ncbi:hypothetical protein Bbelb_427470 [Branchiostoma belcheri]|nr:hypothetical protein Bbelb_427470 [Branchiostoma belcheri]
MAAQQRSVFGDSSRCHRFAKDNNNNIQGLPPGGAIRDANSASENAREEPLCSTAIFAARTGQTLPAHHAGIHGNWLLNQNRPSHDTVTWMGRKPLACSSTRPCDQTQTFQTKQTVATVQQTLSGLTYHIKPHRAETGPTKKAQNQRRCLTATYRIPPSCQLLAKHAGRRVSPWVYFRSRAANTGAASLVDTAEI